VENPADLKASPAQNQAARSPVIAAVGLQGLAASHRATAPTRFF
jgi:hypothetical protein